MKTYIHIQNGFWEVETLPESYKVGTTIDDYTTGAYVALSNEQADFHVTHPEAGQLECWRMELDPMPEYPTIPTPDPLQDAIQRKIQEIMDYDRSEAVNTFFVNGISDWLTPDIRANYLSSIEAANLLGETTITFIIAGIVATTALQDARIMLAKIQRYADNCTIVTETHKANVRALGLATVEEIDAYDNTAGYPEKEEFTITQNVEGGTV